MKKYFFSTTCIVIFEINTTVSYQYQNNPHLKNGSTLYRHSPSQNLIINALITTITEPSASPRT